MLAAEHVHKRWVDSLADRREAQQQMQDEVRGIFWGLLMDACVGERSLWQFGRHMAQQHRSAGGATVLNCMALDARIAAVAGQDASLIALE